MKDESSYLYNVVLVIVEKGASRTIKNCNNLPVLELEKRKKREIHWRKGEKRQEVCGGEVTGGGYSLARFGAT